MKKLEESGWDVKFILVVGVTGISTILFGEEHSRGLGMATSGLRTLDLRVAKPSYMHVMRVWVARCITTETAETRTSGGGHGDHI